MREIDSFFCEEADRTLYHYTGVGSLTGIAKTKSLWASNVYYMNDSEEITHACDVLEDVLLPRMAGVWLVWLGSDQDNHLNNKAN